MRTRFPGLVYAIVSGYGLDGPLQDEPGFDIAAYWSRAGIAAALTPPDGELPVQRGGMGDHTVAMTAAAMISAALFNRTRTGVGDLVSTSLLRQGAYTIGFDVNVAVMWGRTINLGDRSRMGNPSANNSKAGDGRRLWLVGLEAERHWPPLARSVGHPEWIDDPRFATPRDRFRHAVELIALLVEVFATGTLDEWAAIFGTEPDLFWAPVQTIDELVSDPQFHAAGGLVDVPDPDGSTRTMLATPVDFDSHRMAPKGRAPEIGQHTDEIVAELQRGAERR
jgi:crotonobetainyl-CoA:carnitine CoA-transferase CaiB-like acyl-CoA transferase